MDTRMARESPTLLTYMVRPRSNTLMDVVPDRESSNFFSACICIFAYIVQTTAVKLQSKHCAAAKSVPRSTKKNNLWSTMNKTDTI